MGGGTSKESILKTFQQFDADGNGSIDREELKAIFVALGKGSPEAMSPKDLDRLMDMIDVDRDGVIQLDEFVDYVTGNKKEAKTLISEGDRLRTERSKFVGVYRGNDPKGLKYGTQHIGAGGINVRNAMTFPVEKCVHELTLRANTTFEWTREMHTSVGEGTFTDHGYWKVECDCKAVSLWAEYKHKVGHDVYTKQQKPLFGVLESKAVHGAEVLCFGGLDNASSGGNWFFSERLGDGWEIKNEHGLVATAPQMKWWHACLEEKFDVQTAEEEIEAAEKDRRVKALAREANKFASSSSTHAPNMVEYFSRLEQVLDLFDGGDPTRLLSSNRECISQRAQAFMAELPDKALLAFRHHDVDHSGYLAIDEAQVFCRHYCDLYHTFLETNGPRILKVSLATYLNDTSALDKDMMKSIKKTMNLSETRTMEILKQKLKDKREDYKDHRAARDQAAFKVLAAAGRGEVKEENIVAALTPGSDMYVDVHAALGLLDSEDLKTERMKQKRRGNREAENPQESPKCETEMPESPKERRRERPESPKARRSERPESPKDRRSERPESPKDRRSEIPDSPKARRAARKATGDGYSAHKTADANTADGPDAPHDRPTAVPHEAGRRPDGAPPWLLPGTCAISVGLAVHR